VAWFEHAPIAIVPGKRRHRARKGQNLNG